MSPAPGRLAAAGLLSLASAMGVGRFVYTPILPAMNAALSLTAGQGGLIAAANFLGYLLGALLAAAPLFGGRPRFWMMIGLLASAVTTAAMGVSDAMVMFCLLRFVGGVASAFALVFSSTVILDRLAAEGKSALSAVHFAGVGVGIAASALLIWGLNAMRLGWDLQWMFSGAAQLAVVPLVMVMVPASPHAPTPIIRPETDSSARMAHAIAPLLAAFGLVGFGYVITATFLVAIVRGLPQARAVEPLVWLVVGIAAAPSVALWNAVGRRLGAYPAFALGCLLEAAGVALSVVWPSAPGALLSGALVGGTFMGLTALALTAASRRAADSGRALALMTAAFGLGQVIGPLFAGAAAERFGGFMAPTLTAAGALVLAAALCMISARRERPLPC